MRSSLGRNRLVAGAFWAVSLAVPVALGADVCYAQETPAGYVKVVAGTVSAERSGHRRQLKSGDPVFESDRLQTGADGRLGVTLKDETRLSLGPETDVALAAFTFVPAEQRFNFVLRVVRGVMEYISGRLAKLAPDATRIETPSAIVTVRGTRLLIEAGQP